MSPFARRLQTAAASLSRTSTTLPALTINGSGKLLIGGVATRLSGANAYDLVITDNIPGQSGTANLMSRSQVDATLSALAANNQNTFRCHTIFISYGKPTSNMPSLGNYNETVLQQADYVIAKAHEKGLYIMTPLVDRWNYYHGGGLTFAQMVTGNSSATITDFLTDSTVRTQFKTYVSTLLSRTNTVNGLKWKDDPALAIIETGNEVWDNEFQAFHLDMSAWLKASFPSKLVADGSAASGNYPRSWALNDPNTDIVGGHFYDDKRMDITGMTTDAASAAASGKAYIVGEYDWTDTNTNSPGGKAPQTSTTRAQWLAAMEQDGNVQGSLYWSAFTGDSSVSDHGDGYQLYLDTPRNSEQTAGKVALAPHHQTMKTTAGSTTDNTTWTDDFTGNDGDSLLGSRWYVQTNSGDTASLHSNTLRVALSGDTGYNDRVAVVSQKPPTIDQVLAFQLKPGNTNEGYIRATLRAQSPTEAHDYTEAYQIEFDKQYGTAQIVYRLNGTDAATIATTITIPGWTAGSYTNFEWRVIGTAMELRLWIPSATRPANAGDNVSGECWFGSWTVNQLNKAGYSGVTFNGGSAADPGQWLDIDNWYLSSSTAVPPVFPGP